MSKNKGFSNTSANRYSLALYELASEANLLIQVEENTSAFLTLISNNKEFDNLIKDPTVNQDSLINIINKIFENFKLEVLFKIITYERFWNINYIRSIFVFHIFSKKFK